MSVIHALATLLHAANDFAPEEEPDRYDSWRAQVCSARGEYDRLRASLAAAEEERRALREALRVLRSCPDCGANFEGDPYPWRRDSTTRTLCARCEPARAALSMGKGDGTP